MNNQQAIRNLRLQWLNAFIWRQTELVEAFPEVLALWEASQNSKLFGGFTLRELGDVLYEYYSGRITFTHVEQDTCVLSANIYPRIGLGVKSVQVHTIVAAFAAPDRIGELVAREGEKFSQTTLTVSHLCCDGRCLNPRHLTLETLQENITRNDCAFEGSCRHKPQCVFPWYLEEQQRNVKNKHWPQQRM